MRRAHQGDGPAAILPSRQELPVGTECRIRYIATERSRSEFRVTCELDPGAQGFAFCPNCWDVGCRASRAASLTTHRYVSTYSSLLSAERFGNRVAHFCRISTCGGSKWE